MSSALAIAGVSAVIRNLLIDGLIDQDLTSSIGDVSVSALPPDRVRNDENEPSQLNLFLYQVTPNTGWKNVSYPSLDSRGGRIANPPLALDLHYLLSAYGAQDFHAEILLGYAMQLLHETPVLARDAIRNALAPPLQAPTGGGLPEHLRVLSTTNLADQVEQIKIVPQSLSSEEISKLWAAFQTNYRPTAAYHASVVLIERHRPARSALPVQARALHVRQFRPPVIAELRPQFALAGGTVEILGHNLQAGTVTVSFGTAVVTPGPAQIGDDRIEVNLPPALLAGVNTMQVIHDLDFSTPDEPHRGFQSNVAAFVLRPAITPGALQNVQDLGDDFRSAELPLTFDPEVGKKQRVVLLLSEFEPPSDRPARAYSFEAPPRNDPLDPDTTASLTIPMPRVKAGTYLIRVQVDAGESELGVDGTGKFNSPQVTLA